MAGYTPIFDSVFRGSLCGKYPDLPVWLVLLAMMERGGIVDAHPAHIARMSGIPQQDIEEAIGRFCEPDPESRTPDFDGRRLQPLEGRGFGWRVLNHDKYREKARKRDYDEHRTVSGADASRKAASRQSARVEPHCTEEPRGPPRCPDVSRDVPLSDSDANTSSSISLRSIEGAGARATPTGTAKPRGKSASRIPEDFTLTAERKAYAEKTLPKVDAVALLESFVDHWRAASGPKARKLDWDATWRTWVRNANQFGYPQVTAAATTPARIVRFDANGREITA